MSTKSATQQLVDAINKSGQTRYAIAKATGVSQGTLSKMIRGQCWIGQEGFDRLMAHLDLDIVSRKSKGR